jgi:hypothetical protein
LTDLDGQEGAGEHFLYYDGSLKGLAVVFCLDVELQPLLSTEAAGVKHFYFLHDRTEITNGAVCENSVLMRATK